MYFISKNFVIGIIMKVKKEKFFCDNVTLKEVNSFTCLFQDKFNELNLNVSIINDMDNYYFKRIGSLLFLNGDNKILLEDVIEKCNFYCPNEEIRKVIFDDDFVYQNLLKLKNNEDKNLDFVPANLETILDKILDNPRLFYECIANELSSGEYNFIKEGIDVKRSCDNCTSFCCGGLSCEQASECSKWSNDELIGKVKVLSLK